MTYGIFRSIASAALLWGACALGGCQTKTMLGNSATAQGTEHVCSSCHGLRGRSDNATFPNLAAQQKTYLEAQLHAFHDKTRADPHAHTYMWGMAANLDSATIDEVASFYAAQKPAAASAQPASLVAAGASIYAHGISAEKVPPCIVCHGAHAQGAGPFPRLADQHRAYLEGQLQAFKINSRANSMMHANALNMTDAQMRAVAAYLASR